MRRPNRAMRQRIENAIEAMIEALDALDPDSEAEPSLGSTVTGDDPQVFWGIRLTGKANTTGASHKETKSPALVLSIGCSIKSTAIVTRVGTGNLILRSIKRIGSRALVAGRSMLTARKSNGRPVVHAILSLIRRKLA
jgi:hypothetical protein